HRDGLALAVDGGLVVDWLPAVALDEGGEEVALAAGFVVGEVSAGAALDEEAFELGPDAVLLGRLGGVVEVADEVGFGDRLGGVVEGVGEEGTHSRDGTGGGGVVNAGG